jgi:nucleoid DNA-binding protein
MTETELKSMLAMKTGLAHKEAARVCNVLAALVSAGLVADGEVVLPGIGKLKTQYRPARIGRNPKTGETISIQPKRKVALVPAKALRERVAL